jgi:hypothetical protein
MIFRKKKPEPEPEKFSKNTELQVTGFFDMYIRKTPAYLDIIRRLEQLES